MKKICLPLCAALLLAGCASDAIRYYTLAGPAQPAVEPAGKPGFDIAVLPVRVPQQVDQLSLVVRLGPGQLDLIENERWAAQLGQDLRSALAASLSRRLGVAEVSAVPRAAGHAVAQITVDVQRFELVPGASAGLDAVWSVKMTGGDAVTRCSFSVSEQVRGAGYAALVEGQQRAVERLAGQIAGLLARWQGPGAPACAL